MGRKEIINTLLILFIIDCSIPKVPPLKTANFVSLEKYVGEWYEVARLPNRFEKRCKSQPRAYYQIDKENVLRVRNECFDGKNKKIEVHGKAKVVEPNNSKLKVSFVLIFGVPIYIFGGDYWILEVDPNYEWAIVSSPDRDNAWVLSRTPEIQNKETWYKIEDVLKKQNFFICDFLLVESSGNLKKFCE
ncbi:MAG: lipocalin family protein [Leptospiraceae bacterium]|nr:lipocalin family protein [Leptospiraceae bacterium]MDW7975750.1 lipocalin family protein [Leptospiraceae bacterium]